MCGGVGFNLSDIDEENLFQFYNEEEIARFKKEGIGMSFFWDREPVLPVIEENKRARLVSWGNRDKNVNLPKTGWAKIESVTGGKWNYLHPKDIIIPAVKGYEKGKWFSIEKGIKGIKVSKDSIEKVYMITKEASPEYAKNIKHNREPLLIEQ